MVRHPGNPQYLTNVLAIVATGRRGGGQHHLPDGQGRLRAPCSSLRNTSAKTRRRARRDPPQNGQSDLAAMAGVARENVSRVMSDWNRRKVVTRSSGFYCLVDMTTLKRSIIRKPNGDKAHHFGGRADEVALAA